MSELRPRPELPPFAVLAASLRRTTERLARELDSPTAAPPEWSEIDWRVACATASIQGITVLLRHRLRWTGPRPWQSFLDEQLRQSLPRDELIGETLARVDDGLRCAGIGAIALKGSALRRLDLYAPGERPMGDIDLLVRSSDVAAVETQLHELGYDRAYTMRRHIVFEPRHKADGWVFGEHVRNPLKIEVHTAIAEPLPVTPVDITCQLGTERMQPGINAYAGHGALLLHLLLHAAGGIRAHALRQIQLNDIATLARRLADDDWQSIVAVSETGRTRWWLYPPLSLAERYYPGCVPREVMDRVRRACPRWLRAAADRVDLTTVSWSNLRVHAFPGIAWSNTPLEAMRFMLSRVLPSRTALGELQMALVNQPQMREIPWYGKSHAYRILRWVFSQPPRVQTIFCVTAAMERYHAPR